VFCSKCGAAVAANSSFCQTCGSPVSQSVVVAAPAGGVISPHAGVGAIVYASNVAYAGFWLRFVAHLIDSVIIGFGALLLIVPLFFLMGGVAIIGSIPRNGEEPNPAVVGGLLMLIFTLAGLGVLAQWLYFAYLESGEKQATWGKQAMNIYVTDLAGNRISFGRASGRFFGKIVSGLIPLFIGYIMAGFTERKQALHDMIASTLVLRK